MDQQVQKAITERANRKKEAVDGLANMIQMFPDEGRYVPRLLDRLEKICEGVEAAQPLVLAFYNKFLPMVPTQRGSRPSKYCISIHKRGIKRFRDAGQEQAANYFQQRLDKIEAGTL